MATQQDAVRRGGEGRLLYIGQDTQAEQVTPNLPLPFWADFSIRELANTAEVRSGGSRSPVELEEGMYGVEWSVRFPKIQAADAAVTFYNLVVATGSPEECPFFSFTYGDDRNQYTIQDCKCDNRTLEGAAGETEWLTGTMSDFGGMVRDGTAAAQTYLDAPGLAMHEAAHSAWELSRFRSSYSNGLRMTPVIAGPTGGPSTRTSREWDYLTEGNKTIEGEYGLFVYQGGDVNGACLATYAHVMTFTEKCTPYEGLTITWAGQKISGRDVNIPGDDSEIEWTIPWLATNETVAMV